MRTLAELVDAEEPGIELVRGFVAEGKNPVEVLACAREDGERNLLGVQVTTRSPMGALAYETGGLLVDHGWVRVLGGSSARLPRGLGDWNRVTTPAPRLAGAIVVGDDAVGGFFAIDGGGLGLTRGHVCYFAPDTLRWEGLGVGYTDWVRWLCLGDLARFYATARWTGWEDEVRALDGARAFSIYPFLCADGPPVGERSRRAVPVEELWGLHVMELPKQSSKR